MHGMAVVQHGSSTYATIRKCAGHRQCPSVRFQLLDSVTKRVTNQEFIDLKKLLIEVVTAILDTRDKAMSWDEKQFLKRALISKINQL